MTSATPKTRAERRRSARQEAKAALQARPLTKAQERQRRGAFKGAKQMFARVREETQKAFLLGPMAVQMALMQLLAILGPYKSRGKGRGDVGRNYLRGAFRSRYTSHQGRQECMRRVLGGWAFSTSFYGVTKARALAHLASFKELAPREVRNVLREEVFA